MEALRVLARGIAQFERHGSTYIIANILAVLFSLPVVTAPAAFAGLSRLSHTGHTGPTTHLDEFWAGLRANFWRGLVVGIGNVVFLYILWTNLTVYAGRAELLFAVLRGMWLISMLLWVSMQVYLWPLLDEMERPDLRLALRNAFVMTLKNPFFTLAILIGMLVIALVSTITVLPWAMLSLSLMACIANVAVLNRLEAFRQEQNSA